MAKKKQRIIERKLGNRALGYAYYENKLIEIDPRQTAKSYLNTLIHEKMHLLFPNLSERQIIIKSNEMCDMLWDMHYRRIHHK